MSPYLRFDEFAPQDAPAPCEVFSKGPTTVRPERRRERAPRRSKRPDPRALVHHIFVLSCRLRFSLVLFVFVSSSSQDSVLASRSRIRFLFASTGWIRNSPFDLCTTRRWSQSSRRSSPSSTINGPSSRFDTRTSCSKISTPPQPQREQDFSHNSNPTSGHLKVEIPIRPLDTSKLKF